MPHLQIILGQVAFANLDDPFVLQGGDDWLSDAVSIPIQLLLLAGIAYMIWRFLRSKPEFRISVVDGTVQVLAGKLRPVLLGELTDVIVKEGVKRGTIAGHRKSGRIVLSFSGDFVPAVQQQIRNTWYSNS